MTLHQPISTSGVWPVPQPVTPPPSTPAFISDPENPKFSAVPTSLDAQETTEHSIPGSDFRRFLLSGMANRAKRIEAVYRRLDYVEHKNRLSSLIACKSSAWFYQHRHTLEVRVSAQSCNLRWCPLCSRSKARTITANVEEWLRKQKHPRFLTVTLRHNDAPLDDQIDRIYTHWKNLRRNPWFKTKVHGGIWFFQIVKSKKTGRWHPHIHCLVVGSYIDQKKLSERWEIITHDSPIVDVRKIGEVHKAAQYVARYAAAPGDPLGMSEDDAIELVTAMMGRRTCGTFGVCKVVKLAKKPDFDPDDWECIGSFFEVYRNRELDGTAEKIWTAFVTGQPLPEPIGTGPPTEKPEEHCPEDSPETYKTCQQYLF